jgi:hypothetical protein
MRKGIADPHRRAEVPQKANERYLDALASVDDSTRLVTWNSKGVRCTPSRIQTDACWR